MEKKDEVRGYQGWTNYETWTVSLWLDNEQSSYHFWREKAARSREEAPNSSQVHRGIWTTEEAAMFRLAEQLKAAIKGASPLQELSMYGDLLSAALSEVHWTEIAEHWLND